MRWRSTDSALPLNADTGRAHWDLCLVPIVGMKDGRNGRAREFVSGVSQGVLFDPSQWAGRETIVCVRRVE